MSRLDESRSKPVPLVIWFVAYLFFVIVAGALVGTAVADIVRSQADPGSSWKMVRHPETMVRRVQMLFALLPLPWLLRKVGWQGWKDSGWGGIRPFPAAAFFGGWGMAVLTLGVVALVSFKFGGRFVDPDAGWQGRMIRFLVVTLFVAIFEETLVRGILFLPLARRWGTWTAALATSVMFAWAHFLEPAGEAFAVDGFLPRVAKVLGTSMTAISHYPHGAIHFTNLALMGVVLCVITARDKTIWAAAGMHAGWVWLKRSVSITSNSAEAPDVGIWIATRSDFLDGAMTTAVLLLLLLWITRPERSPKTRGQA